MSIYKAATHNDAEGNAQQTDANYRWEIGYEKTWEAIREDTDGTLQASIDEVQRARKRLMASRVPNVRLGMMRHLFLVIDSSNSMTDKDLHPTRYRSCLKLCENFIESYFDQNPISQMGIITSSKKRAKKAAELGGNCSRLLGCIKSLKDIECDGEFSLQNSLEMAYDTLKHVPGHTSKEVLVIMGSLTTCDPGDIEVTVKSLSKSAVKCSVIGLSAELSVCKSTCSTTGGSYAVILDESHFKDLLVSHALPQASASNVEASLIKMGFPSHYSMSGREKPSMCVCHQESVGGSTISNKGYLCPQCQSKYCELPVECQVCGLILVSAPHLARSYHHMFPVKAYDELDSLPSNHQMHKRINSSCCSSCMCPLKDPPVFSCPLCQGLFCFDCDVFIHEMLHSCPVCSSQCQDATATTQ